MTKIQYRISNPKSWVKFRKPVKTYCRQCIENLDYLPVERIIELYADILTEEQIIILLDSMDNNEDGITFTLHPN